MTSGIWPVLFALLLAAFVIERALELLWDYLELLFFNVRGAAVESRSAGYVQFKRATSLLVAVIAGVMLANTLAFRVFQSLAPLAPSLLDAVPETWDALLTGILTGAAAKPVHDLLGIITNLKRYLGASAIHQREAAGAALAEGVLKMAQSDMQNLLDIPGVGPTRLETPIGGTNGSSEEDDKDRSATAAYLDIINKRTAI